MVGTMNHIELAVASLQDKPVDRLSTYPLAMGVNRRLVGTGLTCREWVSDPKKFASAFVAGQRKFDFDWAICLMDLSVMAGDLGADVRMDEQNTPFVTKA
jgi:uroporphyrinogen decarboxylase